MLLSLVYSTRQLTFDYRNRLFMERIKVKIINESGHDLPAYETPSSAGMDVRAKLDSPLTLQPLQRALKIGRAHV